MKTCYAFVITALLLCACASKPDSLYSELGGKEGIEKIVDNFIDEFSYNRDVIKHFEKTDFDHFRARLVEQLCSISGGPCTYTGQSMLEVHRKMNVSEAEFNAMVDDLYKAMQRANVSVPAQNRLIALLAPMRSDIIYH
jgi:hemoglobin